MKNSCKIVTWNINGLKKLVQQGIPNASVPTGKAISLNSVLLWLDADIIAFQEIKINRSSLDVAHGRPKDFHAFFAFSMKHKATAYSGVVTFVRKEKRILQVMRSCNNLGGGGDIDSFWPQPLWDVKLLRLSKQRVKELDNEGRVVITDHGYFLIFNVYCPCLSGDNEERLVGRTQFKNDFLAALTFRIKQMRDIGWRVVLTGDLNAVASPIDCGWECISTNCSSWIRDILGFRDTHTDEEEDKSATTEPSRDPPLLVDLFRCAHPNGRNAFTCWNTKTSARSTNFGSRIDYMLADPILAKSLCMCDILLDVMGSDHCPVVSILEIEGDNNSSVVYDAADMEGEGPQDLSPGDAYYCPPLCLCNFPELAGTQSSIRSYFHTLNEVPTIKPSQSSQGKLKQRSSSFTLKQSKMPFAPVCRRSTAEAEAHNVGERGQKKLTTQHEKETTAAVMVAPEVKRQNQQDAWRKVLSGNPIVLCTGHREPSVLRTVLKSGENQGRRFWVCNRPNGRKGDPQARCNHFEWDTSTKGYKRNSIKCHKS